MLSYEGLEQTTDAHVWSLDTSMGDCRQHRPARQLQVTGLGFKGM